MIRAGKFDVTDGATNRSYERDFDFRSASGTEMNNEATG
jgi:hypothetical protein